MRTAIIILSHGSKAAGSDGALPRIIDDVKSRGSYEIVEQAFLKHSAPDIMAAIETCTQQNAERIVVVPFFMQMGSHVTRDVPVLLEKAKIRHPKTLFRLSDFVGSHPLMSEIVLDLVAKEKKGSYEEDRRGTAKARHLRHQ